MVGKTGFKFFRSKGFWRIIPPRKSLFQPQEGRNNFRNSAFSRSLWSNKHCNFVEGDKLILHKSLANGPKMLDTYTCHIVIIWSKKHLHKRDGGGQPHH